MSDSARRIRLVALEMGYGHLRAAQPLAERLGVEVLHADRPPLADPDEQRLWARARQLYELTSRVSQLPLVGGPLRSALDRLTFIPHLHPYRDLSEPTAGARVLERLRKQGMGRGLVEHLRESGAALLTTFFAPAVIADAAGCQPVYCVVTDSDVNRIWAPIDAARTRIHYLAPSVRVERRLRAYGVPAGRIEVTGFPLPHSLLGGPELPALRRNLAARLVRLDPDRSFRRTYRGELAHFLGELPASEEGRPPRVVFAVGGAGAQAELARLFLPGMRRLLERGRLRLTLVAGTRPEVADRFRDALAGVGLEAAPGGAVEILEEADHDAYFRRFNALLEETDVLWTKPSELTFFAALGLPLLFSRPVGVHERYNRRWAIEAGAGLKQRDPQVVAERLEEWLADGTLAAAAWSGFMRLPKFGLYRILEMVRGSPVQRAGDTFEQI